jgi:hypothetical protein
MLGRPEGQWGVGGERLGELERNFERRSGFRHSVDQPVTEGVMHVDPRTGEGQFHRHRQRQSGWEPDQPAARSEQADSDLGNPERGVAGHDHEVTQ